MKSLLFSFLIIFSVNTFEKCDNPNTEDENTSNLGETFDLPLNESMVIKSEHLKITFESISDSRCPSGVNCIQAGKAKVAFKISKGEKNETLNLESKGMCEADDGSCGSEGTAQGYSVKLINVYPFPKEPRPEDVIAVYAKIVISK